jgi:hypothetical protein
LEIHGATTPPGRMQSIGSPLLATEGGVKQITVLHTQREFHTKLGNTMTDAGNDATPIPSVTSDDETLNESTTTTTTTTTTERPIVRTMEEVDETKTPVAVVTGTDDEDETVPEQDAAAMDAFEAAGVIEHVLQCSLCECDAKFEDEETHAVYCSAECRDKARQPERLAVLISTKLSLNDIVYPGGGDATAPYGGADQKTTSIGETVVYQSTPQMESGVHVCMLYAQFKPVTYNSELVENEDGSIVFPEEEVIFLRHDRELCLLRVEQGLAEVTLYDSDKKPRISYFMTSALGDQTVVPSRTYYTIKNRDEAITLKVSKTLVSAVAAAAAAGTAL